MRQLTPEGNQTLHQIAQRHGVSFDAALTLLDAIVNGGGTQAQFNHFELGGCGQWQQGGMIMVGDMFNNSLKAQVDGLCNDLSNLYLSQPFAAPMMASQQQQSGGGQQQQSGGGQQQQSGGSGNGPFQSNSGYNQNGVSLFVPGSGSGNWWPGDLGAPSSSGGQNNVQYAFFPGSRRLAISVGGNVTVYDTLDNQISGVSQQQGNDTTVTFTSQYGVISVAQLPIVQGGSPQDPGGYTSFPPPMEQPLQPPMEQPLQPPMDAAPAMSNDGACGETDVIAMLERLGALHEKGVLTNEEFAAKKAELLSRL